MAGSPLEEAGGTSWIPYTGLLEFVSSARASTAPFPWVYCRWTFTHDGEGTLPAEMVRTPISTGVRTPLTL